jgi:hypothetical protein
MAYTTGTAATFAAMRTALTDACVADGWTWDSGNEVIWKGTIFAKVSIATGTYGDGLRVLGRTSTTAGDGPNYTQIGPALRVPLVFPVTYHIFTFTNEVMMVVSSGDQYQWLIFGQSQQAGLIGTGNFYGSSLAETVVPSVDMSTYGGTASNAIFWNYSAYYAGAKNCFLDSNIDTGGWNLGEGISGRSCAGIKYASELIATQPNAYNSESVLLPVKVFKTRADSKYSQTMEMENIRHMRIDNYQNEDIITLGLDKWMVLPYFVRNTSDRDSGLYDTGTFGMAVRYEGP